METVDASELIDSFGLPYFRELATFGALSDEAILLLLHGGTIERFSEGEALVRIGEAADEFQVVLQGKFAYYKRSDEEQDVLTRHFCAGDQMGFDLTIGLIEHHGTDLAVEDSLLLSISSALFYDLQLRYPSDFGLLMINLARELAREIALLEDVILQYASGEHQPG